MTRPITMAHRLEYAGLRGAVAAMSALRWRRASALGGLLGRLGYAPFGVRRRVVERQIAAAFPDWDRNRVDAVTRGAFQHLGRLAVETALMPSLGRDGVLGLASGVTGWNLVEQAMEEKRGLLLITGHFGNWELCGAYIALRPLHQRNPQRPGHDCRL
jgi:Kdo2-lipid IVA lauroyltransferase/acyltransferase